MAGRIAEVSFYVFFYCLLHLSVQGKHSCSAQSIIYDVATHCHCHKYLLNYTLKCPAVVYKHIPTVWCADIYNLCHSQNDLLAKQICIV